MFQFWYTEIRIYLISELDLRNRMYASITCLMNFGLIIYLTSDSNLSHKSYFYLLFCCVFVWVFEYFGNLGCNYFVLVL